MRIFSFFKFYIILVGLLFIFYSLLTLSFETKALLFLGITFFSPALFRALVTARGVKTGDTVIVSFKNNDVGFFVQKLPGIAMSSGKKGDTIEVKYGNTVAVGEIAGYGGLLLPPEVNILYKEEEKMVGDIK